MVDRDEPSGGEPVSRGPVLLTDLDNTLYNWVDFFAPSFRAMVHVLARETGQREDDITAEFRAVYSDKGSLEYSFSVQELELCRTRSPEEVERLVRLARGAFSRVREKRLVPYPGVRETLAWAENTGLQIVGVTNAPIFLAEWRLSQLGLSRLFSGLAGYGEIAVPERYLWEQRISEREKAGRYPSPIRRKWALRAEELKPSPLGYLRVLDALGVSHKQTFVIGDSLQKDIGPAQVIGAVGIWAKYGTVFEKKNFDTLLSITHWDATRVAATYDAEGVEPMFTVDSFDELRRLIRPPQGNLEEYFS